MMMEGPSTHSGKKGGMLAGGDGITVENLRSSRNYSDEDLSRIGVEREGSSVQKAALAKLARWENFLSRLI